MSITAPKPLARIGTYSPRHKQLVTQVYDARFTRAQTRFQVARFAAELRRQGQSFRAVAKLVGAAIESGLLPRGADYSHESIRSLITDWEAGQRSVEDYLEAPKCGRPGVLDAHLRALVVTAVKTDTYGSVRRMHQAIKDEARRLGVRPPSYDTVKKLVRQQGQTARSAAAFGARVAQMEGMAYSTVPTRHTHDAWVLDEMDAPFYACVFDPDVMEWVSVRPSVIVLVDHRSGACLGYEIADPSRRRDPETKRIMRAGFDAADVMATLVNAAMRDLAAPATAEFAGYLPRVLRWDNHRVHQSLRPILTDLGAKAALQIGSFFAPDEDGRDVEDPAAPNAETPAGRDLGGTEATVSSQENLDIPKLPINRPINRGKIENKVGFLKQLCREFPSHIDRVIPLDRLDTDPKRQRDVAAGAGERTYRRDPIDVRRLPTIAECRTLLDGRVRYYNFEHRSRLATEPPAVLYRRHFPSVRPRKGNDLLAALETRTTFVSGEGIVHYHDTIQTTFAYAVEQQFILPLGAEVTYKADPLLRGIFLFHGGRHYLLPPKDEWAAAPGRAEEVARTAVARARFHAGSAINARARSFDDTFGPGAAKADQERAKAGLERKAREEREAKQHAKRTATPTVPPSPEGGITPPASPVLTLVSGFRPRVDRLKRKDDPPEPPPQRKDA